MADRVVDMKDKTFSSEAIEPGESLAFDDCEGRIQITATVPVRIDKRIALAANVRYELFPRTGFTVASDSTLAGAVEVRCVGAHQPQTVEQQRGGVGGVVEAHLPSQAIEIRDGMEAAHSAERPEADEHQENEEPQ